VRSKIALVGALMYHLEYRSYGIFSEGDSVCSFREFVYVICSYKDPPSCYWAGAVSQLPP
jgi:hypothetical protein